MASNLRIHYVTRVPEPTRKGAGPTLSHPVFSADTSTISLPLCLFFLFLTESHGFLP